MKTVKCHECGKKEMKEVKLGKNSTASIVCSGCGTKQGVKVSKNGEMSIRLFESANDNMFEKTY